MKIYRMMLTAVLAVGLSTSVRAELVAALPDSVLQSRHSHQLVRPVSVVLVNARPEEALVTLSRVCGISLKLDASIHASSLPALSVVAHGVPAINLLQQIATAEGLTLRPTGEGLSFFPLTPAPGGGESIPSDGGSTGVGDPTASLTGSDDLQPMYQYVMRYAAAPVGSEMPRPDRLFPGLNARSGALRYVAVVTEALGAVASSSFPEPTRQNMINRLRALLGESEQSYETACRRDRLSAEIQLLSARVAEAPAAARPFLNQILQRRQQELYRLGRP